MGETGSEAGGIEHLTIGEIEHISDNLLSREKAVRDAIDRGDAEIELDCFDIGSHLGIGQVCCDHWGRIYWYRPDTRKLVKIYDPTEARANRVDTAVVKQLNKSMNLNRDMKMALLELQKHIPPTDTGYVERMLGNILRMS